MSKVIEIIVSAQGATKVETKGFSGPSCREASRFIEQSLGQKTAEITTGEFHQTAATKTPHHQSH